jgi:hypothetical protein
MPYQIGWMIENDVIYSKVWDKISEEELRAMLQDATKLVESSSSNLVHIINDSTDLNEMIPLHKQIKVYKDFKPHPNSGWTLMVGQNNAFKQFVSTIASHVLGVRTRTFDTLDQAMDHLQKLAPQLEWDKAVMSPK